MFQDGVASTLLVRYVQQGMFLFFDLLGQLMVRLAYMLITLLSY